MRKTYKYIALAMLACASLKGMAQEVNVVGKVVDRQGNPVGGALISVENDPLLQTTSDRYGKFEINVEKNDLLRVLTGRDDTKVVPVPDNGVVTIVMDFASEKVNYGFGLEQTNAESTGAVSTVYADQIDNRSAFNVGNALYGNVTGLYTLQTTGNVWEQISSMAIRGPKTLTNQGILLVVDGIERDNNYQALNYISPEEVESVSILRDAAAVALYGFRGVNGVVNIVTKRGKYKGREIDFTYDHGFNYQTRIPEMADAYTYALAMNEALANDGSSARYSQNELEAFRTGKYPYLYPNVNWVDEVFRNRGNTDLATLTFRGGTTRMRYFTMLNLQNNRGFIKNAHANEGYSTQDKYSRLNFRSNLDIDLTRNTRLQANISGVLSEFSRPSSSGDNLIGKLFTTPAAAFPIRTENGLWGGNNTWSGDYNPVYLAQGHGYTKGNTRALYADMRLEQDLSSITKGLGASVRIGYDNLSSFWEDYRQSETWGMTTVTSWVDGEPAAFSQVTGGTASQASGNSYLDWQYRSFNFQMNVDWKRRFGKHDIYTMLLYTYKFDESTSSPLYTQSTGWYTHYGYKDRYYADFTLMFSASNRIDPDTRWMPSPTVGVSWVISNEAFMRNQSVIDFMKLRASFGIIPTDYSPADGYWYNSVSSAGTYPVTGGSNFSNGDSGWSEGRLPTTDGTQEKAYKYNIGLDVSLLKGLNFSIDGFYERRSDIFVSASGQNSAILGVSSPYVNAGIVDSWGTELGVDYSKSIGDFKFRVGGTFSFNRSEIIENLEEPQAYDYLSAKGKPLGQLWGLIAIGHFVDQADIDNSPAQQFGPVQAGDLKYKDVNGDGVINEYDMVPMGYSSSWPEIYYGFNVGFEWKGLGFNAYFQGVGHYTASLTSPVYRPLVNNTSISKYAYENRWTPENPTARFPRLTTETVNNNLQNSSVWYQDRSFMKLRNCEVYYKIPSNWLDKIKLKQAKVYVRGVDLFSIDNIPLTDPEAIGGSDEVYPATRSVHIGFSVGI